MIYHRYVLSSSSGESLHGNYISVHHVWENADGTSLFRVECDDAGWITLNADTSITVLPSLDAPADRLSGATQAYFTAHGVTASPGDTLLNMLRKVRAVKLDMAHVLIDKPY